MAQWHEGPRWESRVLSCQSGPYALRDPDMILGRCVWSRARTALSPRADPGNGKPGSIRRFRSPVESAASSHGCTRSCWALGGSCPSAAPAGALRLISKTVPAQRRARARGRRALTSPTTDERAFKRMFAVSALYRTSRALREEVRQVRGRDVVDWTDWFFDLGRRLPVLRQQILSGSYSPNPPTRYELPKTKGSFRIITVPNMRDVLVYRHIADVVLRRALPSKVKGAFFSRRHTPTPIGPTFDLDPDDPYHKFFKIWLTYNTYRSRTLLNQPHDILVVTDISNYFDSIQHDLLLEYFAPLGLPRKTIGLLGRLLEAFKPESGHSPNPRVGLAQDELDCSRELAHVFLFEHDQRIAEAFGEDRYVRWLDDQNIGTTSFTQARTAVNVLTRSLASQRLTLNAGKTRFLDPGEVVVHFQLEANRLLDDWNKSYRQIDADNLSAARRALRNAWSTITSSEAAGKGNWDKILKRMYAFAVQVDIPDLEPRALDDLIESPDLDERIFNYFSRRNRPRALLDLFKAYRDAGENLFEATDAIFFDAALRAVPTGREAKELRALALSYARRRGRSRPLVRASAIVLLYWMGVPAEILEGLYTRDEAPALPKEVARAWMACAAARDPSSLTRIQALLLGHPSDDVARLARFLTDLFDGALTGALPLSGSKPRWPQPGRYYDARAWIMLELAAHSPDRVIRAQVKGTIARHAATVQILPERRVLDRIQAAISKPPTAPQGSRRSGRH